MSDMESMADIYGAPSRKQMANKGSKQTQSGQIHFRSKKGDHSNKYMVYSHSNHLDNNDMLRSFDHKSEGLLANEKMNNLYSNPSVNESATQVGGFGMKHNIVS